MKDCKLCIATPSTGLVNLEYAIGIQQLTSYFITHKMCSGEQGLGYIAVEGSGVSANREKLVGLSKGFTHILFVDQDVGFAPEAIEIMIGRDVDVVGCNYKVKIPNGNFMAMSIGRSSRVDTTSETTGIEPVFYTGMGFCLIRTSVFDKIEKPWFLHTYNNGEYTTEETSLGLKLRDAGIPWYVDHDASKMVEHVGYKKYRWDE